MVEQIKNSNLGTDDYILMIQNYFNLHEKEGTSISSCFERLDDENMGMYCILGTVYFFSRHMIKVYRVYKTKWGASSRWSSSSYCPSRNSGKMVTGKRRPLYNCQLDLRSYKKKLVGESSRRIYVILYLFETRITLLLLN